MYFLTRLLLCSWSRHWCRVGYRLCWMLRQLLAARYRWVRTLSVWSTTRLITA